MSATPEEPSSSHPLLTSAEAASILRVAPVTLDRYRKSGKLKSLKINSRRYLYRAEDVRRLLQGGGNG